MRGVDAPRTKLRAMSVRRDRRSIAVRWRRAVPAIARAHAGSRAKPLPQGERRAERRSLPASTPTSERVKRPPRRARAPGDTGKSQFLYRCACSGRRDRVSSTHYAPMSRNKEIAAGQRTDPDAIEKPDPRGPRRTLRACREVVQLQSCHVPRQVGRGWHRRRDRNAEWIAHRADALDVLDQSGFVGTQGTCTQTALRDRWRQPPESGDLRRPRSDRRRALHERPKTLLQREILNLV